METHRLREAVAAVPAATRWGALFTLAGLAVIAIYVLVGLGLAGAAGSYFAVPKVDRDAAAAGSVLQAVQQYLQATGTWLEPFKFTGLSLIITGIVANLVAITGTLRTRAAVLHAALTAMKGGAR